MILVEVYEEKDSPHDSQILIIGSKIMIYAEMEQPSLCLNTKSMTTRKMFLLTKTKRT